jgi:squalene-hopene/tetraprenyl-beta-curcumene cyclase
MNQETMRAPAPDSPESATSAVGGNEARTALERAVGYARSLQNPEGWWKGELETNVTMDAEDLMLREFLGIRQPGETERAAVWIRAHQRADGSWSLFEGGPADVSTTVEAYVALRLAGDSPDAEHMRKAAALVRELGGIEGSRVFTRVWLALFGAWPWERLPALAPEMMFLPKWAPLNIYNFACWARQTIVPLTIVFAHRPERPLPFGLEELHSRASSAPRTGVSARARALTVLDRVLHGYHRVAPRALREVAMAHAERWIVRRQEADGGWGGIQPPWVYSLIALHLRGYPLDHPVMRAGFEGLDGFTIDDERGRRVEACQSPVWDTALATVALGDAGVPPDDPMLVTAADWLLAEQVVVPGDWAVRRPALEPAGWSFEFANDSYPDLDDTAEVVLALRRVAHPDPERVE